jgi:hypothetical protein
MISNEKIAALAEEQARIDTARTAFLARGGRVQFLASYEFKPEPLAAHLHPSAGQLREVLASSGNRARDSGVKKIVAMAAMSKAPHQIVWQALDNFLPEEQAQEAA